MNRWVVLLGLIMVVTSSPVWAAEDAWLGRTSKDLMVKSVTGGGFVKSSILRKLRAGDQVMANETGSGWIVYCGCDVEVEPGRVYSVENRECKVESVNIRREGWPHRVLYPDGQRGEEVLTKCRLAAWWLLPAAVGVCAAAGCFDDDDDPRRRARVVPRVSP